jgi:hypothetical protein
LYEQTKEKTVIHAVQVQHFPPRFPNLTTSRISSSSIDGKGDGYSQQMISYTVQGSRGWYGALERDRGAFTDLETFESYVFALLEQRKKLIHGAAQKLIFSKIGEGMYLLKGRGKRTLIHSRHAC